MWLALACLAALGQDPSLEPAPGNAALRRVVALEIEPEAPVLAGRGPAVVVDHRVDFRGTLYVWAQAQDLDLFLRVENRTGGLRGEDDDSGGGATPCVILEVEPGDELVVHVAAKSALDAPRAFELCLIAAPETETTRAASAKAQGELAEVQRLRAARSLEEARARLSSAIDELTRVDGAGTSASVRKAFWQLGFEARELGALEPTRAAWSACRAHDERTLPGDHPDLQRTRANLAITIKAQGDLPGARALEEQVLAIRSRTLPAEHPDLQLARGNLAYTLSSLGDFAGARALEEQVLAVRTRTLPDDHADLQAARANLALTIKAQGDLVGARALEEQVLAVRSRTLPAEDPQLQAARGNLAGTLSALGDLAGARVLEEQVLEVFSRTLPAEHPNLQKARANLALTLASLGDLEDARALEEQVLEVRLRTLPAEHPDLQSARANLALVLKAQGDLAGARALQEQVLEVRSRTLPAEHPRLQAARGNLASTLSALGDLEGARALEEQVLAVFSRTLPDDHLYLQTARLNLAATLFSLGDRAGARALFEQVLEVRSRTLPDDHPDLQVARANLALTLAALGDLAGARVLQEQVFEVRSQTLPDDHPDLDAARAHLAVTTARLGEKERCIELLLARCAAQTSAARKALLESSPREAQARCEILAGGLDLALSFAAGCGVLEPVPELDSAAFVLSETTRGAALGSAALMRRAAGAPRYAELRLGLRQQSTELAGLAQQGTTSAEFQALLARRDATQRELVRLARELAGGSLADLELDVDGLARRLAADIAVVAFRRTTRFCIAGPEQPASESLCAWVLRRGAGDSASILTRVELGPVEPIEAAVRGWRAAIGAGVERGVGMVDVEGDAGLARGLELRRLVFDPLLPALGDAERVVLALDAVLHLVPMEALPLEQQPDGSFGLVGERWHIETRCTLAELLAAAPESSAAGALVAVGGAAFNSEPLAPSAEELAAIEPAAETIQVAAILRGGLWERGFSPLSYTGLEAREIAALYGEVFGEDRRAIVLEKKQASRASLEELAPGARFLHVATHGWFASESIRSWQDPEPLDRHSGLGMRLSGEEQIKGMSPLLLCGLALAGANLPENALGRAPGLITAEELSALDLSGCELAVLSACDTNVGERRAGQGVASLQMALQMAGARSVITSLWKVPDEATRELMLDFYRRLWVERKPKHQALWEAKLLLRNARDEAGHARYSTRDWAAWVLTGEPD